MRRGLSARAPGPGATTQPWASMTRSALSARSASMATMRPARMATSPRPARRCIDHLAAPDHDVVHPSFTSANSRAPIQADVARRLCDSQDRFAPGWRQRRKPGRQQQHSGSKRRRAGCHQPRGRRRSPSAVAWQRLASRRLPSMAQLRSADRVQKRPMLGVDRTYDGHHETGAIDPQRTWPKSSADALIGQHEGGEATLFAHCWSNPAAI